MRKVPKVETQGNDRYAMRVCVAMRSSLQPANQPKKQASKRTRKGILLSKCDTVWSSTSVPTISRKTAALVISMGKSPPMILVRNQIRNMFGGETDKITFGKLSKNLGLPAKKYSNLVHWEGADFVRLLF